MGWVDIVIIGIILLSLIVSIFRGLVREALSLAVWIAAFYVAYRFVDVGAAAVPDAVATPSARLAIAFAALFIATLLLGGMITWLMGKLVDKTGLGGTDRVLGAVFGAARGAAIVVALVMFAGLTPLPNDPWWQRSRLLPYFEDAAVWVADRLPESVRRYVDFQPGS